MGSSVTRRIFLKQTSVLTAGVVSWAGAIRLRADAGANEKVRIGIIGCNGRGMDHIAAYCSLPDAEIAYVCDVDNRAVEKGMAAAARTQDRKPQGIRDLR